MVELHKRISASSINGTNVIETMQFTVAKCWIPNPRILGSKPLGGSKIDYILTIIKIYYALKFKLPPKLFWPPTVNQKS